MSTQERRFIPPTPKQDLERQAKAQDFAADQLEKQAEDLLRSAKNHRELARIFRERSRDLP